MQHLLPQDTMPTRICCRVMLSGVTIHCSIKMAERRITQCCQSVQNTTHAPCFETSHVSRDRITAARQYHVCQQEKRLIKSDCTNSYI